MVLNIVFHRNKSPANLYVFKQQGIPMLFVKKISPLLHHFAFVRRILDESSKEVTP